ncbi:hypothetical protein H6P81_020078 [Aristolochia fimbriata]|uniref:Phosphotransferase n=1 Tax=Aristolochia fimbriata TaxID=158543 RepID=A0AAV7DTJ6_ARIFI|nr:hypothetical protein H6P81_020078 [Aristolochia fimbriata]
MRKEVVVAGALSATAVVGLVVYQELKRTRHWRRANRVVNNFGKQCATPLKKLLKLADAMAFQMQVGLASDDNSRLQMIATDHIDSLPTGDEEGLFYGMELGRTDLRLSRVKLGGKGSGVISQEVKTVPIPTSLMVGSLKDLLDFIAGELQNFVTKEDESFHVPSGKQRQLGFAASFPVYLQSDKTVIQWSRGFSLKDTEGKDMIEEINRAIQNKGIEDLHVSALVNDTVATLASGRYFGSNAVAAVILGMSTNASYVEEALTVPKCKGPLPLSGEMVIDIEWGNFHSEDLPITEFDICLDVESLNPGEQIFDKLISGVCLGEIVRKVLLRIGEETPVLGNSVPPKLRIPFALRTSDMAAMHQDSSEGQEVVGEKLKERLGIVDSSPRVRELAVKICEIVAKRAARLSAAAIVGILKKQGRMEEQQQILVAVDGGPFEHYRLYRDCLQNTVNEMLGSGFGSTVVMKHLCDGAGIGAALLAASFSHYAKD